jgi:hypothetical protein
MKERLEYVLAGRDELTRPLKRAEEQMKGLEKQAKRTGTQMNQFGGSLVGAQKNLRKFALGGVQQAGYQIGDFAVQVANGTSRIQAFGQQAGQFLQIFGPFGAVLGAAVSVISAVVIAKTKASEAAERAAGNIMSMKEAVRSLGEATATSNANLKLFISGLNSLEELTIQKQIVEQQKAVLVAQKNLLTAAGAQGKKLAADNLQRAKDELARLEQMLVTEMLRIDVVKNITNQANSRTEAGKKYLDVLNGEETVMSQLVPMHQSIKDLIAANAMKQAEINKALQDQNRFANSRTEAAKKLNEQINAEDIVMSQIVKKSALVLEFEEKRLRVKKLIEGLKPEKEYGGRGGDPRKQTAEYMKQMGYTSVDDLIKQLSEKGPKAIKETAKVVKTELSPEIKRLGDLADHIGMSFENAFMSAIDGSMKAKDAFKVMAADIIRELYRVFVVKQITGFITDAFLGATIGPMQGPTMPNSPRMFAGGGYTGNGARAGGMDGKGGFMAMLHPRETVVDHTRGQSAGVTVVQNINVSTGVQQTVRTEIKSLMPQIAESAKAAVADAKRRGGSYGRAFA